MSVQWLNDLYERKIRFTRERQQHIETDHPEMQDQISKIQECLLHPDKIVRSKTDVQVEMFYKYYSVTPVTQKYMCVVTKATPKDVFMITAYFTDVIKKGEVLWQKK